VSEACRKAHVTRQVFYEVSDSSGRLVVSGETEAKTGVGDYAGHVFSDDVLDCVEVMEPYDAQAQPRDAERVEASRGQATDGLKAQRPGAWMNGQASGQRRGGGNMLGVGRERQARAAELYARAAGFVARNLSGLLYGFMKNTTYETNKDTKALVDEMLGVFEQLHAFLVELWGNDLAQPGVAEELEQCAARHEFPIPLVPPATIDPLAFLALDPPNNDDD